MKVGSGQFNKRQYEEDRKKNYNSQKEFVAQGIRAVLTMYMARERDPLNNGLDILVNDRISEWRTLERIDKFWGFKKFMFINFFIVAMLGAFGQLNTIQSIFAYLFAISIITLIRQLIKLIFIRGNVGTKYTYQRLGVKRAIRDVWFETIISVQISYFIATAINLFLWILSLTLLSDVFSYVMGWFVSISDYLGDLGDNTVEATQLLNIFFISNLVCIWVDFIYWKLIYTRNIPLLPFEHEDAEEIILDENDISLNDDEEYEEENNSNISEYAEENIDNFEKQEKTKKNKVKKYLTEVKRGRE